MKKLLRIIGVIVLIVVVLGIGVYLYVFHKPHRDISSEKAAYQLQSTELTEKYAGDQNAADSLYLDQVVQVSGTVEKVDSASVILEGGVNCNLVKDTDISTVSEGSEISLKGRVVSFDELFEEVRMDNCEVVQ